jgi:hypothetical protein
MEAAKRLMAQADTRGVEAEECRHVCPCTSRGIPALGGGGVTAAEVSHDPLHPLASILRGQLRRPDKPSGRSLSC